MNKKVIFKGCATALVTPFKNGVVNYNEIKKLIEFQIRGGIDAIVVCGTTGEAPVLEDNEHLKIIEYSAKVINGRVPLIAGTGSNYTDHAVMMSKEAKKLGADALLCVTPYYNKATDFGLIKSYTAIAESTDLPVILYNVPSRTSVNISLAVYRELAKNENIVAVKEASGNMSLISQLFAECRDKFSIYCGNDDIIVPMLSLGGSGAISVLSNIIPRETKEMYTLWSEGQIKKSAELQLKYMGLINALFSQVNPIPVKAALAQLGFDTTELRLPLCPLEEIHRKRLINEMEKVGLFKINY